MIDPGNSALAPRNAPEPWLSVIGIGEDGVDALSPVARRLIAAAHLVVGGERHLKLAGGLIKGHQLAWPRPFEGAFPDILALRGTPVTVLATGDPFHFGVGKQLAGIIHPNEMVCLPQPSAFSLAAARLGWALQDVSTISLHGRDLHAIVRHLHRGARILALSWDGTTPTKLAKLLTERGLGDSLVTVLERMGSPDERILQTTAASGFVHPVAALNTLAVEVAGLPNAIHPSLVSGLDDALFSNDGQLTKREVRAITLSSLGPRRGELLWDVGLGAGSIAIEWLLADPTLRAIGIEERPARADTAARNAAALGTPELQIVTGRAPETFAGLPSPDAIFIGGGITDGVIAPAWSALKPGGRMVANAVTLEGEATLLDAFRRLGGDLTRIEVSRAAPVGTLSGWRPAMPITHWRAVKP